MKRSEDTATHFLACKDPQTGRDDLLDCIPWEENPDGTVKVVVFSDGATSTVCVVEAERVLSVDDIAKQIVTDVLNDMTLVMLGGETSLH